ncbi:MAG TPA: PIN domain-containing protein [Thermoguttaceae bacterium]|nr:PIN domain-containing protein [Thermoguttaceae bacterium]
MTTVFLDTVALLALWDRSDQWHAAAEEAFSKLTRARSQLVTTTFILLECGNAAARRPYRSAVDRLRRRMESAGLLITPTDEDWQQAWAAYAQDEVGDASIVDHVSFVVMGRLGIIDALTNDHHFRTAGFNAIF